VSDFEEHARKLEAALDAARAENDRLEEAIRLASDRAQAAESRAAESVEKLRVAENLREQQYQAVISELFERPSRRAAWLTVIVAALTTFLGIAATLYTSQSQQKDMQLLIGARLTGDAAASAPASVNGTPIIDAANNRAIGVSIEAGRFVDFRIPASSDHMSVRARAVSGDVQLSASQDSRVLCKGGSAGATRAECEFKLPHKGDVVLRVAATKASVIQMWWQ
jgi:hypothetical protein